MIINKFFELRDQSERLRLDIMALLESEQPGYRNRLQEEIDSLKQSLDQSVVPDLFRIAVVGTFKTGKSSFVNKLAEEKLAGVETNPETAAISIFRYADEPRAEVKLISLDDWQRMDDLYEETPKHPEAYRVDGLRGFNDQMAQRKNREGQPIDFDKVDVDQMIKDWLKPEGYVHIIEAEQWDSKKGKQAFRKEIRKFTSSNNPLHYFVKELVVYAPVPLLRDHVELIDTPGLNDTQLFRGQLTEQLLSEVDAILFLTRSGASFSQFDKEFLVRQLRKKRLRHLRLIVTQVDTTYDNARRDALEDDETPPTFQDVRNKEEARLRGEISRTLDELMEDTDLKDEEGCYYIDQLAALTIHFTSSAWFDEGNDDSGIAQVREALFEVLSENYHIQQLVAHLEQTLVAVRGRLKSFFVERRSIMETEFDPTKVENNMVSLETQLGILMDKFHSNMSTLRQTHDRDQTALVELMEANIARMQLLAKVVLSDYEKTDVAKHWKTRRHGHWGFLSDLGGRVADRVFPVMENCLSRQLKPFAEFIDLASLSLNGLQSQIESLEANSEVEGLPKIEFGATKERFMIEYVNELKGRFSSEKDAIIQLLENFATEELSEKRTEARGVVGDVWGTGTTVRQNSFVSEFYDNIGKMLTTALESFLGKRLHAFSASLSANAETLFPKLRTSIEALLATRKQAIEEHLKLQTGEAKERLEKYLNEGLKILEGQHLVGDKVTFKDVGPAEKVFNIAEGDSGYSYDAIFGPYLKSAKIIEIKEPYLRFRHQLDNFQRFCELVSRSGLTRQIELTTGQLEDEDKFQSDGRIEDIRRLLQQYAIEMKWKRDPSLHAREIKTNDGWVILSDRGLDIYKKPENRNEFGHFDLALRQCKQTQIHIRRSL
ncbi:MAG: MIT C-terminal domain-containing protein [Pseudomonadota bacterium]